MTAIVPQRDQRGISMQTLPERIADEAFDVLPPLSAPR